MIRLCIFFIYKNKIIVLNHHVYQNTSPPLVVHLRPMEEHPFLSHACVINLSLFRYQYRLLTPFVPVDAVKYKSFSLCIY